MKFLKNPFRGFTPFEWSLWLLSLAGILLSYFLCGNTQFLYLIASLLGATALIFVSKGHVLGQILTVVLTARRSALYALAYAANDVVLILLWSLASATDREYLSMVVCFAAFFLNDVYGFFQWQRMRRRQEAAAAAADGDADAP